MSYVGNEPIPVVTLPTNVTVQGVLAVIGLPVQSYADDTAAAAGGVVIGGLYHTAGTVKVRLA